MIRRRSSGITRLEVAVIIGMIAMVAAILVPSARNAIHNGRRTESINTLQRFAKGSSAHAAALNGLLPLPSRTPAALKPAFAAAGENQVWYNSLAPHLGIAGIAMLNSRPLHESFYRETSPFFLRGATYDRLDKGRPQFAFGMNANLVDWTHPTEWRIRQAAVTHPSQTVLFAEGGLKGEKLPSEYVKIGYPASPPYAGTCAVEAKDFIARHSKFGVMAFADNHVESKMMDAIVDRNMNQVQGEIGWKHDGSDIK